MKFKITKMLQSYFYMSLDAGAWTFAYLLFNQSNNTESWYYSKVLILVMVSLMTLYDVIRFGREDSR